MEKSFSSGYISEYKKNHQEITANLLDDMVT